MGKRGAKPRFTDVFCPNQDCKFYGISGKGNIIGNGTYQIKNKRVRKYICRECGRVFNDRTETFFDNIRKDELTVKLALKMILKGMSIQAIADVLEVQPATVSRWLLRAAKQCEKVNEDEGTWMWVSFAPETRLIIDFVLGPRKQYVANELIQVTDKH
ncbi:MAG: helix-turn-helix domain-containing protein, partial [Methanosarcina sp.]|nr:helix-turn-helix domain-containing protein [Methanosarcina sp.]MDD4620576.1 helix-turn-helix domain-containing protein [Methanosarcina sp.]